MLNGLEKEQQMGREMHHGSRETPNALNGSLICYFRKKTDSKQVKEWFQRPANLLHQVSKTSGDLEVHAKLFKHINGNQLIERQT